MRSAWKELALAAALALAVAVTGLSLAQIKHEARRLFVELEELNREQDRLQIDWGRLQLEQSTWANQPRIESLARERLAMELPQDGQVVIVSKAAP